MSNGRWTGRWYEWACPGCGCVLQAIQAPQAEQERCLGCRAARSIGEATAALDAMSRELADSRALVRQLQAENGGLLDDLYAARLQIASLTKADTAPPSSGEVAS